MIKFLKARIILDILNKIIIFTLLRFYILMKNDFIKLVVFQFYGLIESIA